MFEYVGKNPDEEANKRRAGALAITTVGLAALLGVTIGIAAWTAAKVVQAVLPDEELVEVIIEDPLMEAPPPPPPPPPASSDAEEPDDPDEMTEEIKDLADKVEEEVKSDTQKAPDAGVEGGVVGGVIGGVVGGVVGGVLGGQLGVRVMHHSELEYKKQIMPTYPKAAATLNLGDVRCVAKVWIDETGTPYQVAVDGCPEVFHTETKEAILQWRWWAPKVGKEKTKAQTSIGVVFKMQ